MTKKIIEYYRKLLSVLNQTRYGGFSDWEFHHNAYSDYLSSFAGSQKILMTDEKWKEIVGYVSHIPVNPDGSVILRPEAEGLLQAIQGRINHIDNNRGFGRRGYLRTKHTLEWKILKEEIEEAMWALQDRIDCIENKELGKADNGHQIAALLDELAILRRAIQDHTELKQRQVETLRLRQATELEEWRSQSFGDDQPL